VRAGLALSSRVPETPHPKVLLVGQSLQGRAVKGAGSVPPSVPLSFMAAASAGLVGCGVAFVWSSRAAVVDPTADPVVAAVHLGVLATLSMGVLGAMHHFIPLLTHRPLRSVALARVTFWCWLGAAWLLPVGVATGDEAVVEAGGGLAAAAITLAVLNLSAPLGAGGRGASLTGMRLALAGFVATAGYGLVYVADRRGGWFDLSGQVVLAHAVVGLFAWLGLAYVSVAEKLWPMFLLTQVSGRRIAPWVAVLAMPVGVALLSPGLLTGLAVLAWVGAAMLAAGLGAHLASLATHLRHRRRSGGLDLLFVVTSALFLPVAAGFALAGVVIAPHRHHLGAALIAAAVAASGGWLLVALVGFAHKVAAFIVWPALRSRGVRHGPRGETLQFSDLFDGRLAVCAYACVTGGVVGLCAGFAASVAALIGVGGGLLVATAMVTAANLTLVPLRRLRARRRAGYLVANP
jgi:hypothetical protein